MDFIEFVKDNQVAEMAKKLKEAFPGKDFAVHRAGETDETSLSNIVASCPDCKKTVQVPVSFTRLKPVTTAT